MAEESECVGQPTTLYRVWTDPGNGWLLLYVGISTQWERRMESHRKSREWWTTDHIHRIDLEHYCCRVHAAEAEAAAIVAERPLFNIEHNLGRQVSML